MELLQLTYFRKVAETQNFTKAAEQLYISQSSLSQTIQHLENELGYQLFDRKGRSVQLNQSGELFLKGVIALQNQMEATLLQMDEMNGIQKKEISIYVGCASLCLPDILRLLQDACKDVTFRIMQMNQAKITPETDLAIVAWEHPIHEENAVLLLEEDIQLVLPQKHELMKRKKICLQDLSKEKFIALNKGWSLEKLLDMEYKKSNFRPNVTIRLDNPSIMRKLLREEIGIAFVPTKTWKVKDEKLGLKQVSDFYAKRYVYLKWKQDSYVTENMKICIQLIQKFFEQI